MLKQQKQTTVIKQILEKKQKNTYVAYKTVL